MSYAKHEETGFGPGRPRKGESRPLTDRMLRRKKYYQENRAHILEQQREARQRYLDRHPGRETMLRRESYLREKTYGDAWEVLVSPRYPVHTKKK